MIFVEFSGQSEAKSVTMKASGHTNLEGRWLNQASTTLNTHTTAFLGWGQP